MCFHIYSKRISSLNNGKKYVGVTYIEEEDADLSQRIRLTYQGEYVIRIDFTSEEIKSTDTFCRSISEIISRKFLNHASHSQSYSTIFFSVFRIPCAWSQYTRWH